jgi:hypothetical protein
MKVTLMFPTYLHLSGFISVTDSADIDMNVQAKSLTAVFSENEITIAVKSFNAQLQQAS